MITIKERIIKSYEDTRYLKLLYDNKKWYQYPQTIYFAIFISLSSINFVLERNHQYIFWFIWLVIFILGVFAILNPWNKKRVKSKMGIEPKKGKFSNWANTEFREGQLTKFYKLIIEQKILYGNIKDINLLGSYEKLFLKEAELFKSKEKLLLGGGIILLFILPIWNTSTALILADKGNFIENLKLIFKFIFLIYCLIYIMNLMKFWIEEILNKTYWKYIDIQRNLHQIKLNLEIENAS